MCIQYLWHHQFLIITFEKTTVAHEMLGSYSWLSHLPRVLHEMLGSYSWLSHLPRVLHEGEADAGDHRVLGVRARHELILKSGDKTMY